MNLESLSLICVLEFHIGDGTEDMTACQDTIYYSNKYDYNKLYKINGYGTGKAKLFK
ncbi:hypothetical protein [Clostridium sp. C2-6-12]|uniref:hypothetical protein n=1 Tax=Clostridium sp. C2-6-12 TaxID=2698832 RepID=UPI00136F25B0|nr:hypothetical protein [Clostridium sp. C2-6-12]